MGGKGVGCRIRTGVQIRSAVELRNLECPLYLPGITGNSKALQRFRDGVVRIWRKWLTRRRRRGSRSWIVVNRLLAHYALPAAIAVHSVCRRVSQPVT